MSYRLIDGNAIAFKYPEVNEMPCVFADLPDGMNGQHITAQPKRKKGEWTTHEVACLLAEVMGDDCACNVNGNDEWLPFVCEFAETTCPDVVGVTCWEQWLAHRKEKEDAKTN